MSKRALLMYSCDYFRGGLWRYAYNLSKNLLELDQDNQYSFVHAFEKKENFIGLEKKETLIPLSGYKKILKLPKILDDLGFETVHQTENSCPLFSKRQKYKKIITIQDLTPLKFPKIFSRKNFFYYNFYLPMALKRVDVIITPSESTKNEIIKFYKIPASKIIVIYDGIEDEFFERINQDEINNFLNSRSISQPYFMGLGINYHRNLGTLFKAYGKLPDAVKEKYKLLIAGATGLEHSNNPEFIGRGTKNIMQMVKDLGMNDNIKFIGSVTDHELRMLYQGAFAFLFPSLSEGFGFPPLEAMASGCPVISSNATSMPEVIGEAGVLIDPLDVNAWTDSIVKLVSDDGLRQELSKRAVIRAKTFSWKKCALDHIKIYNDK